MPVGEERVDQIVATVTAVYDDAELAVLRLVTARLARGLDAADWQTKRLQEIGQLRAGVRAVAVRLGVDGPAAVRFALADAWRGGSASAVQDLAGHALVPQRYPQAVQGLVDAVVGEFRAVHQQILPSAESAYRRAVAAAAGRKLTGVASTRRAAQAAWATLVDDGITGFTDSTGRRWRLSTYVEMSVRTAVTRAIAVGVMDQVRAAGELFVYVNDRPQECRLCRDWEHKILVVDEPVRAPAVASVGEARGAGLHHPNCRHDLVPYLPGRTRLAAGRPDPAGDAARQQQRYLERQLRHWREREIAALSDEGRAHARARVAAYNSNLLAHLHAHPTLRRMAHREHPGAGYAAPPTRRADTARI